MDNVLIVGSLGLDTLKTPYGEREDVLGGSCSFASFASKLFAPVNTVGVVGYDFPQKYMDLFISRGINIEGLETSSEKTFRWKGEYKNDMGQAETLETQLNAFASFNPVLPENYKNSEFVFLANIHPDLQLNVLNQIENPKFVIMDTMNLWISTAKERLMDVISKVDLLLVNDAEARMLCEHSNLVAAAKEILEMGPRYVVIKKGEHGSMLLSKEGDIFVLPAFPLDDVIDPTGAGDTFAGGLIGYLASLGEVNCENLKRAIGVGTILASFTAQEFSSERLVQVEKRDLYERYEELIKVAQMESLEPAFV